MTDDLHSNAELYAIGALDADEAIEFEAHLSQCDDCREEVAAMRDLTARLSQAVATDPPVTLRASILDAVASTPQDSLAKESPAAHAKEGPVSHAKEGGASLAKESPATAAIPGRHAAAAAAEAAAEPDQSTVVPIRRSWATRASSLVAAAAVVGAVAFGTWAISDRNAARDDARQASQLIQVLSAGDAETASAVSPDGGTATVVRSKSQGVALLVASDLPDVSKDDKVYEAWTIDGQTPVPAGIFSADDQGNVELPAAALETDTVAVTVEDEGGSDTPTSDIIMAFDLSGD